MFFMFLSFWGWGCEVVESRKMSSIHFRSSSPPQSTSSSSYTPGPPGLGTASGTDEARTPWGPLGTQSIGPAKPQATEVLSGLFGKRKQTQSQHGPLRMISLADAVPAPPTPRSDSEQVPSGIRSDSIEYELTELASRRESFHAPASLSDTHCWAEESEREPQFDSSTDEAVRQRKSQLVELRH